jgi:two-component system cell cycle response regulator
MTSGEFKFEELKASGLLPSPKGVALAVMDLAQDENATNAALARTIQADPALSGRLVKAANTVQFRRRRPVASVPDAVMVLGMSTVRQLALGFALVTEYRDGNCEGFDYDGFWSRSLVTGIAMQAIVAHTRVAIAEEMFLVGLLSRIGCLALATVYPRDYAQVLNEHANGALVSLSPLERHRFAVDHNELTVALMRDWGLPSALVDPVLHQEHPATGKFPEGSRAFSLCHALNLAGYFADLCLAPEAARPAMLPNLFLLGSRIGLDAENVSAIAEATVRDWQEWGRLLEVRTHRLPTIAELAGSTEQSAGKASAGSGAGMHNLRLLVVDDDPTTQLFLDRVLTDAGYLVATASNGCEALERAVEFHPQLVVVDWLMPQMDGLQFCRALRSAKVGRGVYVVMLTAVDDEDQMVEAYGAGIDDYVMKPINPKILLARLRAGERVVQLQHEVESDREDIRRFAAELAMSNRRLEEVALLDSLTGIPNRRYAMERIQQEWAAAQRGSRPLACMLIDVDHFKQVNDTYGHDVGDSVLIRVADVLKHTARTHDVVCRIGGEEFLMVCPDSDAQAAGQCAERLRQAVGGLRVPIGNVTLQVTISVGVAAMAIGMRGPEAMVKAADEAVYAAKQAGRNRTCIYRPQPVVASEAAIANVR